MDGTSRAGVCSSLFLSLQRGRGLFFWQGAITLQSVRLQRSISMLNMNMDDHDAQSVRQWETTPEAETIRQGFETEGCDCLFAAVDACLNS